MITALLEYAQWAVIVFLAGGLVGTWWGMSKGRKETEKILNELIEDFQVARGLISVETTRKKAHTKAFEALSNAEQIAEEMENSAQATEMRIARRTTLPRENAGPPAKVYRPKLRKKYPRSWPK
jgi:hypothetical protein